MADLWDMPEEPYMIPPYEEMEPEEPEYFVDTLEGRVECVIEDNVAKLRRKRGPTLYNFPSDDGKTVKWRRRG